MKLFSLSLTGGLKLCVFCSALLQFQLSYQYKRVISRSGKVAFTKMKETVVNKLGIKEDKWDFYLGGTDSCQGNRKRKKKN